MSFDVNYVDHPWESLPFGQHEEYDPLLANAYVRRSVYSQFINMVVDLGSMNAQSLTTTDLIPPRHSTGAIDNRTLWLNSNRFDSLQRDIAYQTYGGKLAFHEWDQLSFWLRQGSAGLNRIVDRHMAPMIVDTLDLLAFYSFLRHPRPYYEGGRADFSEITSGDTMSTGSIKDLQLGLEMRQKPWVNLPVDQPRPNNIICITSPGVVFDLKGESSGTTTATAYTEIIQNAEPSRLLQNADGNYLGVTFIKTNLAVLWNCGIVEARANITATVQAGDGAPDPTTTKVYDTYRMGQRNVAGQKHYVQVNNVTGFDVGDYVTIHTGTRTDYGIDSAQVGIDHDGVDWTDPQLHNEVIIDIDVGNSRLIFAKPLQEDFKTDLGAGVYGYVTKAQDIHTAVFLNDTDGILSASFQPPRVMRPPVVDDMMAMNRVTWKARMGYNLWQPESFEVWFGSGSSRRFGPRVAG